MAGNVNPQAAPRNRYIPRGHPISWWMLVVTTGAILISSIDSGAPSPTTRDGSGRWGYSPSAGLQPFYL